MREPRPPARFSKTRERPAASRPRTASTPRRCSRELGYDAAAIAALRAEGVIP